MRNRIAALALVTFSTAALGPVEASDLAPGTPTRAAEDVKTGTRVRVTENGADKGPLIGWVVGSDAESLTLRTAEAEPRRVLLADVKRLEVR